MEIWLEVTLASPRSPEIFSFGVVHRRQISGTPFFDAMTFNGHMIKENVRSIINDNSSRTDGKDAGNAVINKAARPLISQAAKPGEYSLFTAFSELPRNL